MPWGGPATPIAQRLPALRRAVAKLAPRALWPFGRNIASGNGIVKTCSTGRPSRRRPFRAASCPRYRCSSSAATTTCRRRSRGAAGTREGAEGQARRRPRGRTLDPLRAVSEVARAAVSDFLHQARTTYGVKGDGCATGAKAISFRASDGVRLHGVLLGSGPKGIVLRTSSGPTCATGSPSRRRSPPAATACSPTTRAWSPRRRATSSTTSSAQCASSCGEA